MGSIARRLVRTSVEWALASPGMLRLGARARRGDALILSYHNVIPSDDIGDEWDGLHLPARRFSEQLDAIERTHEIVPLESLLTAPVQPRKPRVAITFDDAYRGALEYGVTELVRRGHPCTVFVVPAFVGTASFWWDALRAAMAASPNARMRDHVLSSLRGQDGPIRAWAASEGIPMQDVPDYARPGTLTQLERIASLGGVTLGSHSWSHANLTLVDDVDLEAELRRPLEWLEARFDTVLPWIAYPYGITSDRVERAAAASGYIAGLGQQVGWLSSTNSQRFQLPRLDVPAGMTVRGFAARASGLWP